LFYRERDRDPFVFAGLASPIEVSDTTPVRVIWEFESPDGDSLPTELAEEEDDRAPIVEGARRSVVVNVYERDPNARRRCIARWGLQCQVCEFDFAATYGQLGAGFIHVHHLKPLGELRREYELDPEEELRPVCPNCHAMLHREQPAMKIGRLKEIMKKNAGR
jgi:5-methylcytosine-specific restriction enzyme A